MRTWQLPLHTKVRGFSLLLELEHATLDESEKASFLKGAARLSKLPRRSGPGALASPHSSAPQGKAAALLAQLNSCPWIWALGRLPGQYILHNAVLPRLRRTDAMHPALEACLHTVTEGLCRCTDTRSQLLRVTMNKACESSSHSASSLSMAAACECISIATL